MGSESPSGCGASSPAADQGLPCGAGEQGKHKDGLPWHRTQVDDDEKKVAQACSWDCGRYMHSTLSALWVTMSR
ncbi:hypothetical protein Y1Q_0012223 [Alligator mississippiensis]|uniref:Uncharacterized protein n=1 Tax=Alligator mississippiensis TaxID=8496 RepID=A0A151NWC2_ALLMI|nr:hypothetical protein Y1Q_0012223 [Alligator mississippiensis]